MKKLLAMFLALVMALGLCSVGWADDCTNGDSCTVHKAAISGQHYATLAEAITATKTGDTVKLLADATGVDITGPGDRMVTIDLNGHNLTGSVRKDHDLTITDTSAETKGAATFDYVRCNVLYLSGGTVTITDAKILHALYVQGADVTINGGEYHKDGTGHTAAINVVQEAGSSLTVNSGVFQTQGNLTSGGNTVVTCSDDWFAVGRATQGEYTVQAETEKGNLYFYDLYTAVKAAKEGATITLLGDQTVSKQIAVDKSLTINGNRNKISLAGNVENGISTNYGHGVFQFSGNDKTAVMKNLIFEGIDIDSVLIRAYNSGDNSCLTVDGCTFDNVKAINMVRGSSSTAVNCALKVTNCVFKSCETITNGNGVVQIDNGSTNAAGNEIRNNSFIGNEVKPEGNAAVIYLSAPATVQNNCFEGNKTTAKSGAKNGIVVTGSKAGASTIKENAFVSHTFTDGDAQGAIYGAASDTTVDNNYYGGGIDHTAKAGAGFAEGKVASSYNKNAGAGASVSSGSSGKYYYTKPSTDTAKEETKGSPKTFDAGVGIYAVTAVLSVTGMAWVGKKRH